MWHSESLGYTVSVNGYLSDCLTYRPVSSGDLYLLIICWIHAKNILILENELTLRHRLLILMDKACGSAKPSNLSEFHQGAIRVVAKGVGFL